LSPDLKDILSVLFSAQTSAFRERLNWISIWQDLAACLHRLFGDFGDPASGHHCWGNQDALGRSYGNQALLLKD
jgi:hypothetical protein